MAPQTTFPQFGSLPETVRKDIWERAAQDVMSTPSVRFLNLTREYVDEALEDRLMNEAVQATIETFGSAWEQLTPNEQGIIRYKKMDDARSKYRGSLVRLAPAKDTAGLSSYSFNWRLNWLAAVNTEADQSVRRRLRMQFAGGDKTGKQIAPFDPSEDIVCLTGPENTRGANRFFEGRTWDEKTRPARQVVFVASERWRRQISPNPSRFWEGMKCNPLHKSCPETTALKRVAFIFQYSDFSPKYEEAGPFSYRVGIHALLPENLPALKEIYLIDESISLRAGVQQPRASTPRWLGCGATFYEISQDDADLWNITPAPKQPVGVMKEAWRLQNIYRLGGVLPRDLTIKVLACIPDTQ